MAKRLNFLEKELPIKLYRGNPHVKLADFRRANNVSTPSDAHPFGWCVENSFSSLRNDCPLRDPGMTRRRLHKTLVCLHFYN